MKKILFVAFILSILGCKKNELPEPTQEGNNTFGMLVNGEVWKPYLPGVVHIEGSPFDVDYDTSSYELYIMARNKKKNECVDFYFTEIKDTGSFYFAYRRGSSSDSVFTCIDSTRFRSDSGYCLRPYTLKDTLASNLHITRFDTINNIISGTFSVTLFNPQGDKLEITNGRFDAKY